jgi:glycerol uptake facilitator-like aquaporin
MDERTRAYLAELLGTFLLVFFSAGAICAYYLPSTHRPEVAGVALAQGCTLAVLLTATLPLSRGCLNPALALTFWVFKRLDGRQAILMILVQLLGAALGGLGVRLLFSDAVLGAARMGACHLGESLREAGGVTVGGLLTGFGVELLGTVLLTVAIFAAMVDPRTPRLGGLLPGLAQIAFVVLAFHLTGGAANPARWFGPVVWEFTLAGGAATRPLADNAIYWAGPVFGSLLGGFLYSTVILPPAKEGSTAWKP